MGEHKGYLCIVLHAHLPYVRHPDYEAFLEEDWLYEAITETYIPLILMMERLIEEKIDFRLTMSISPPLAGMLSDPLLQERYLRRLGQMIELAEKEVERTRWMPDFQPLAIRYLEIFREARHVFAERYGSNLLRAFRLFQDSGALEILTCGATHGYLPLMRGNRNAWRGQIVLAAVDYRRHFGRPPRGIWLPECGYEEGIEDVLSEAGIGHFVLDSHGLLHARPRPKFGVYAPIVTRSGVAAFGRDVESSKSVWSKKEGYPGDPTYREFYRDVGWDLEYDYIRPYLHGDGQRTNIGIKYYRITGEGNHKDPYSFDIARSQAAVHAGNFMFNRQQQIEHLSGLLGRPPVVVAPYDAELFGHWWFEGPQWLDFLIRKLHYDQDTVATITPSDYMSRFPSQQIAIPSPSSWGYKGFSEVWLNGTNDWIYPHIHLATDRMIALSNRFRHGTPIDSLPARALNQAARELLLAQSSDWAFIMRMGTMVDYAIRRTKEHVGNFTKLYEQLMSNSIDVDWLASIEYRNNIFPDIDYKIYADPE